MFRVRDRFVIGAYTLMRVSDYSRLTEVNFNNGFIWINPVKKSAGKKNRDVIIPIHPIVREILDAGHDLSHIIPEQKINKHIKEIARIAGIDSLVIQHKTEGGRVVEKRFKKWQLITTHTARRCGATNMILAGMVEEDVMAIGGWKTVTSFRKYLRMVAEKKL